LKIFIFPIYISHLYSGAKLVVQGVGVSCGAPAPVGKNGEVRRLCYERNILNGKADI
jgi:hypothetical protein